MWWCLAAVKDTNLLCVGDQMFGFLRWHCVCIFLDRILPTKLLILTQYHAASAVFLRWLYPSRDLQRKASSRWKKVDCWILCTVVAARSLSPFASLTATKLGWQVQRCLALLGWSIHFKKIRSFRLKDSDHLNPCLHRPSVNSPHRKRNLLAAAVIHQDKVYAKTLRTVPKHLSPVAGTQCIDRHWRSLKEFIGSSFPRKKKANRNPGSTHRLLLSWTSGCSENTLLSAAAKSDMLSCPKPWKSDKPNDDFSLGCWWFDNDDSLMTCKIHKTK